MVPCQSKVENVRVKDLGKLKSHKPPNPIKRMNKNLSINRYTLLEIKIVIEDLLIQNYLKKSVKQSNPC